MFPSFLVETAVLAVKLYSRLVFTSFIRQNSIKCDVLVHVLVFVFASQVFKSSFAILVRTN